MKRCNQPHRVKARREQALKNLKTQLAWYISGAMGGGNGKKKRRQRHTPSDLDKAIEYTKNQIAVLEDRLGIKKTKAVVFDDESATV